MQSRFYNLIWLFAMWLFCSPVFAVDFLEVDYSSDLRKNPIFNQYDYKTGRFKNTNSEIKDIKDIENDILNLRMKLNELEKAKTKISLNELTAFIDKENFKGWNTVSEIDNEIILLNYKIEEFNKLKKNKGKPSIEKLYEILNEINHNVINSYKKKDDLIVINKLPLYNNFFKFIKINNKIDGYYNFIEKNNEISLHNYIVKSSLIGSLFPNCNKAVLYTK